MTKRKEHTQMRINKINREFALQFVRKNNKQNLRYVKRISI